MNNVRLKFWRLQCSGGPKKLGIIALEGRCYSITHINILFLLTLTFQTPLLLKQTFCYTFWDTHIYAQVATQLKFSTKPLSEKQSEESLDSHKCASHGWTHSPVFNKVQAASGAFSILGPLSASLPWTLRCLTSLSLITACAKIYTQSGCVSLISWGN